MALFCEKSLLCRYSALSLHSKTDESSVTFDCRMSHKWLGCQLALTRLLLGLENIFYDARLAPCGKNERLRNAIFFVCHRYCCVMLKKILVCCLMAVLVTATAWAQEDENGLTAAQLREKGINAEKIGLPELAERYYRRALESAEGDPTGETHRLLGILMEQKEYFDEAIMLLNQNNTSEALAHQAYCLLQLHDLDSASHCAQRAIEMDTASALAKTMMAYVETERDQHINAIAWANRALRSDPKFARGENVMGYIQYRKGNHTEAMRHFKKAIQLDSTLADAYYNLGTLYCMRNSQEMAIKLLKQGLRRNPRNIRLYTALAYAYRMRGDNTKALACYKQILEYDSLHTPTLNRIGTVYCGEGHYEEAIAYHKRALNIRPNDAVAYKYIGKAYIDWGKYDKAIQSFIRSTDLCKTDPETYMYLAELYGKQKKGERKQQTAYKKAARLGNKDAQTWLVKHGISW